MALSSLLLLAACANLANMLFARGSQRAGEVAVRLSLGASRVSDLPLFLLESVLVAAMASVAGLAIAHRLDLAARRALPSVRGRNFQASRRSRAGLSRLPVRFGAGAVAAFAVGASTAWRASGVRPLQALASLEWRSVRRQKSSCFVPGWLRSR